MAVTPTPVGAVTAINTYWPPPEADPGRYRGSRRTLGTASDERSARP